MSLFPTVNAQEEDGSQTAPMLGITGQHPATGNSTNKHSTSPNNDKANMKKVRLINDLPPVQNGVVSASNTPPIDEGRVDIEIQMMRKNDAKTLSVFFNDKRLTKEDGIPEYKIADCVMQVLKDRGASEEDLRNAVFTDLLDNHSIKFLPSSCSKAIDDKGNNKYTESQLCNLLAAFGKKRGKESGQMKEAEKMRRIMRGLPVTTTSLPDLAPLDDRDNILQIWLGELKNHNDYKEKNARTQCLMYLVGLLYWLRTVLGKPVETVYGFYICGCRCSDQREGEVYTVGLLKLSAPQYLGDEMKAECLSQMRSVSDPFPLRVLIHFFKLGRRWTVSNQRDAETPIPSLFVLPTNLWTNNSDRELVIHGTLSVVFLITAAGLNWLLRDNQSPHFKDLSTNSSWKDYCDKICDETERPSDARYYLKIRSKGSSWQSRPMAAMDDAWDLLIGKNKNEKEDEHGFLKTYRSRPFVAETFGLVLMNNRGCRVQDVVRFDRMIFCQFSKIMSKAMFLCGCLPHGDVLPHNLVYDKASDELTLIDIDEGVAKRPMEVDRILQRKNEYHNNEDDWYIALSYPNLLREEAILYTKSQLIASFLYLLTKVDNLSKQTLVTVEILSKEAKNLGKKLRSLDKNGAVMIPQNDETITKLVEVAYNRMESLVGDELNT